LTDLVATKTLEDEKEPSSFNAKPMEIMTIYIRSLLNIAIEL